ncbi:DUF7533 family protein [Natronosalvus vescus]|uniref:DUF7533 family protein n=1 Tax=Natronosalvus vescus TaxID=2953881 RepID=UPI002090FBC6|nr:hypothetical protein [Natronosalvus vescus]
MAGLFDTIKLVGVLIFAIPAALAGLEMVATGSRPYIGSALIVCAVVLVLVQRRLTTPGDVPGLLAKKVTGSAARTPEREEE